MRHLLTSAAVAALAVGLAPPANAILQFAATVNGANFFCADQQACDTDPLIGILQIANQTTNGVVVNGSIQTSTQIGQSILNSSNFQLINLNAAAINVLAAVGDTSYTPPATLATASGSGTFQNAVGGDIIMGFFNDPTNTQGADNALDTPGIEVANSGLLSATSAAFSYAFNPPAVPVNDLAAYSMTLFANINLPGSTTPGVAGTSPQLINRGQTLIKDVQAVPEPQSLALLGTALLGTGLAIRRRRSQS